MTIEKILEIKNELVNQGIIKPEINDSKLFLKLFEELKEWFKWDIQRFPYKELTDPIGYRYDYRDRDLKFYNENYDLIVFSAMVSINICKKKGVLNNVYHTAKIVCSRFTPFSALEDGYFYKNYQKICGIGDENLGFFIMGMIRNKMGNGTFEEFLNDYTTILQKYKPVPLIDKDGTIETTAIPVDETVVGNQPQATLVVSPAYQPAYNVDPYAKVKAKYGFIPAAYSALQSSPIGLWYTHQQTGQCRSKFVDYTHRTFSPEHCYYYQDLINHINKIMSNRAVYEEILNHMPIIGTEFVNTKPVLFDFLGFSRSRKYVLGARYGNHTFIIKVNIKSNKFITDCGVNDEINRKIDDYLNE